MDGLLQLFPSNAADFPSCFCLTLLEWFDRCYGCYSLFTSSIDNFHRVVELSRPALASLVLVCSHDEQSAEEPRVAGGKSKRVSQRDTKRLKRAAQMPTLDSSVFERLNLPAPSSKDEAVDLVRQILGNLKEVLKVSTTRS